MTVHMDAETLVSASVDLRPYCLARSACQAKKPGRHCAPCAAKSPERNARVSAGCRKALENPEVLARKQAAARRVSADPSITARKKAAMLRAFQQREVKARHKAGCTKAVAERMLDAEFRERLKNAGKAVAAFNAQRLADPAGRQQVSDEIRSAALAWCPRDQWQFNKQLKRMGYTLEERKSLILKGFSEIRGETGAETVERISREMHAKHARDVASRY